MDGGGAIEKRKWLSVCSNSKSKVCFVSCAIWKDDDDDDDDYYTGCHVFLVDLSELDDAVLEPTVTLDFGFCYSVCGVDSTLYFADSTSNSHRNFYALDIPAHQSKQKKLHASDLRTLPLMRGTKRAALVTPIPATKKILVFSSLFSVYSWILDYSSSDRDRDRDPPPPPSQDDDGDDDDGNDNDFEVYDIETNSWEKLPDLIFRMNPMPNPSGTHSYFFHQSYSDRRGIPIPGYSKGHDGFMISQYTFIHNDTVFLAQLKCGAKFTLNLNSPSKTWQMYNDGGIILNPSTTSHLNDHLFVVDQGWGKRSWCASQIGGDLRALDNLVSFPLSSFCEDDQVKQRNTFSTLTPLEGDKGEGSYVCIVQGGVSRKSKSRHGRVIMDVMDVKAKNQPQLIAARRFEVMHHYKTFWPFCMFVYHSN